MVENFQRSYQELEETHRTDIMGIYGNAHIVNTGYLNAEYYMAKQLKESYDGDERIDGVPGTAARIFF